MFRIVVKLNRNLYSKAFLSTSIIRKQLSKQVLKAPKHRSKEIGPFGWLLLVSQ